MVGRSFLHSSPARALCLVLAATLASGCLSSSYEVPRDELDRLVQLPPAERGRRVRAVQRFAIADDPPPAPAWPDNGQGPAREHDVEEHAGIPPAYYGTGLYLDFGAPYHPVRRPAVSVTAREGRLYEPGTLDGGGLGGGTGSRGRGKGSGVELATVVVVAVVAAAAVGVALAVSEGGRYDGAVAVHPRHPVHLVGPGNQHQIVGLDQLGPQHLGDDTVAILVGDEGAGLWRRGRAPLSRAGFTYRFGLGRYDVALDAQQPLGAGGGEVGFGYFPTQWAGLLLTGAAATGSTFAADFHTIRLGAEAQWLPIQLYSLHLGGYAGLGHDWQSTDGGGLPAVDRTEPYIDLGGLLEIDVTTRLGFLVRAGAHWLPVSGATSERWAAALAVGLAVY